MKCLTFSEESVGLVALDYIWRNSIKYAFQYKPQVIGGPDEPYTDLSQFTVESCKSIYICGEREGVIDCDTRTTSYSGLNKAFELEMWYFVKPFEPSFLIDVAGYVEKEFDPAWNPSVGLIS